jgi:hypothetical protein
MIAKRKKKYHNFYLFFPVYSRKDFEIFTFEKILNLFEKSTSDGGKLVILLQNST